jgi:hypothetical protein
VDAWIQDVTSRGGKARAESMSADERRASARKAATARWAAVPAKERTKTMRKVGRARWGSKKRKPKAAAD